MCSHTWSVSFHFMLTFTTYRHTTIFSLNQLIDRIVETFQLEDPDVDNRQQRGAERMPYLFLKSTKLFQGVLIRCLHLIAWTLVTWSTADTSATAGAAAAAAAATSETSTVIRAGDHRRWLSTRNGTSAILRRMRSTFRWTGRYRTVDRCTRRHRTCFRFCMSYCGFIG